MHHRNLVALVGYCKDGHSLGLVFEYAAQGSLKDHLSGAKDLITFSILFLLDFGLYQIYHSS